MRIINVVVVVAVAMAVAVALVSALEFKEETVQLDLANISIKCIYASYGWLTASQLLVVKYFVMIVLDYWQMYEDACEYILDK